MRRAGRHCLLDRRVDPGPHSFLVHATSRA